MKADPRVAYWCSTQPETPGQDPRAPGPGHVIALSGAHLYTGSWDLSHSPSFSAKFTVAPSSGQFTAQQPSVGPGVPQGRQPPPTTSLWEVRKPGRSPAGPPGQETAAVHARAQMGMASSPCFLQTRGAFLEPRASLPQAQADRRDGLLPGAQGQLRMFISHSHLYISYK